MAGGQASTISDFLVTIFNALTLFFHSVFQTTFGLNIPTLFISIALIALIIYALKSAGWLALIAVATVFAFSLGLVKL